MRDFLHCCPPVVVHAHFTFFHRPRLFFFSHNFFFLMLSCQRQRKQIMQIERTALGVAMHELSSTSDKQEDNQEIRNLCFLSPPLCQSL